VASTASLVAFSAATRVTVGTVCRPAAAGQLGFSGFGGAVLLGGADWVPSEAVMAEAEDDVQWADDDENPLPIWLEGDSLAPPCQADFDVVAACALCLYVSLCHCWQRPPCLSAARRAATKRPSLRQCRQR
jgi:hypothetical protein